ncbi:hypothetical protein P9112_005875 [Eukaryota sp. TZLM1-RC]
MHPPAPVRRTSPFVAHRKVTRPAITVNLPDAQVEVPSHTTIIDVLAKHYDDDEQHLVACTMDNLLTSLSQLVTHPCTIVPVFLNSELGTRIYRATAMFGLAAVSESLFPNRRLVVSHSVSEALYYFYGDEDEVSVDDVESLNLTLMELVQANFPIVQETMSHAHSVSAFRAARRNQTVLLLQQLNEPFVKVNRILNKGPNPVVNPLYMDLVYFDTCLAASTGIIQSFSVEKYRNGLLLRFPTKGTLELAPFEDNLPLFNIYQEYNTWGHVLGVSSVGHLNQKVVANQNRDFIMTSEALHDAKIAKIADSISTQFAATGGIVLLAGPSSSGKTTMSMRLGIALRALGKKVVICSLDSFYLPRLETPLDEEGRFDFESVHALDLNLLKTTLVSLLNEKQAFLPSFDFKSGLRIEASHKVHLEDNGVLILEGLHALNPLLTEDIDIGPSRIFKIFISPLCQLNVDDHNRISTSDTRLCRRLLRDFKYRGNTAHKTFELWPAVVRGEQKWIYKYQDTADAFFNSALDYEFAVLSSLVQPLLRSIPPDSEWYSEARRLIAFLSVFYSIDTTFVPPTSILREFIGNSWFEYE